MAVYISGPRISIGAAGDIIELNCPIKKIILISGATNNLFIDGKPFYFSVGRELNFPNIKGYPGGILKAADSLTQEMVFIIEEIGDVLNLQYFQEEIKNWNGQGAAAVSGASEAPKKAAKSKKAEVTE